MKVSEAIINTKTLIPNHCGHCGNKKTLFAFRGMGGQIRICPKCQKRTGIMDYNQPVKSKSD